MTDLNMARRRSSVVYVIWKGTAISPAYNREMLLIRTWWILCAIITTTAKGTVASKSQILSCGTFFTFRYTNFHKTRNYTFLRRTRDLKNASRNVFDYNILMFSTSVSDYYNLNPKLNKPSTLFHIWCINKQINIFWSI